MPRHFKAAPNPLEDKLIEKPQPLDVKLTFSGVTYQYKLELELVNNQWHCRVDYTTEIGHREMFSYSDTLSTLKYLKGLSREAKRRKGQLETAAERLDYLIKHIKEKK